MQVAETLKPGLVNDCVSFHQGPFVPAWMSAYDKVKRAGKKDLKILELGAQEPSVIAPIFYDLASTVVVSCYHERSVSPLRSRVSEICERYSLDSSRFSVQQMDSFDIQGGPYDLIISNRMLGGLSRTHDLAVFRSCVQGGTRSLSQGGILDLLRQR